MKRLLTSWVSLVLILAGVCAAAGFALQHLQGQVQHRADLAAIDTSNIVAALVVHRNVNEGDILHNTLTATERADMNADVSVLLHQDRLVGLEVWATGGQLIYADKRHPTMEAHLASGELARASQGGPWVGVSSDTAARGVRTVDVFLPYHVRQDGTPVGFVEVLLPQNGIADQIQSTTRSLNGLAVVVVLATIVVLLLLRRRLRTREHQALHDSLTGVLNRGGLRERAQHTVLDARAVDGQRAALLVIDLDRFKAVNDTLGHPAGDALLVQVAHTLQASVRGGDVVARLGGDEFAILLTELPVATSAEAIARKLLEKLRGGSYTVQGIELSVDASIGIALLPEHGHDTDLLLQHADVAMSQAKRAGAGVNTYDPDNDPHDVIHLGLLVELRRAIEADELVLHYQPKARLTTGDLVGVEALVRWQHPTRGLLAPGAFIPLAENTGLMQPLTNWVLQHAIAQAARWRDDGLMLPVAVNVSPRSLLEGDLPGHIVRMLAAAGLPADLLELEITETAVLTDPDRAVEVLRELQAIGLRVAIDDYGAGNTSLNYLVKLPVQTLKIDMALVSEILTSAKGEAIVESIVLLGHKLGLTVLAEGIESSALWERLENLNCDEAQGYFLARPMRPTDLVVWITDHIAGQHTST